MLNHFAQVTGVPQNGASNASDFQPPTRNPQQAPGSLQQGGQLNGIGGSQDILTDNPNTEIIVPVNPAAPNPQTLADTTSAGGWGIWYIVMGVLIVAVVVYAWLQSYRNKRDYGMRVKKVAKEELVDESKPTKPPTKAAKKTTTTKKAAVKTPPKPKKKQVNKKKSRKQRRR